MKEAKVTLRSRRVVTAATLSLEAARWRQVRPSWSLDVTGLAGGEIDRNYFGGPAGVYL